MDREKVIADIEEQIAWIRDNDFHKFPGWGHAVLAMKNALDMLKEQEAVEPEVEVLNEIDRLYKCPRCHKHFFYKKQKYCDQCGQAVKWE